jgi:hypothetical protein
MPLAKHRTPIVPAKVKVALDLLFNDPTAESGISGSGRGDADRSAQGPIETAAR